MVAILTFGKRKDNGYYKEKEGAVMAKFNKKIVMIVGMLIFSFLFVEIISGQEVAIDYSSEPIRTVVANQNCLRNGEYGKIWRELLTEITKQELFKDSAERHKEMIIEHPDIIRGVYTAKLQTMTYLTPRRIWVKATSSYREFPGFYLIKEGGRWKVAKFKAYTEKAVKDMQRLCDAIKAYYGDNRELPTQLAELLSPVTYIEALPQDPFNDEGGSYVYTSSGDIWELYSLGPDSDDDLGLTRVKNMRHMSDGDLIVIGNIQGEYSEILLGEDR